MILAAIAIIALPVGFLAAGVAINAWRAGEGAMALKAVGVFAICAAAYVMAPKTDAVRGTDCYTDWDGRSNPTVCDN